METIKKDFSSWTEYDNWLIESYANYSILKVNEENGRIFVEFCQKADWVAANNAAENEKK